MLYGLLILVHVIACITMIASILLQAGRGGGLSETFGLESGQTIFGTKVSVFLTKATIIAAVSFLMTSLVLGIMTTRRGRSLIELKRREALPADMPYRPSTDESEPEIPMGAPDLEVPADKLQTDAPVTESKIAEPVGKEEAPLAEPKE